MADVNGSRSVEEDAGELPGPDGWPVLGVFPHLLSDPLEFYETCHRDYGTDVVAYDRFGVDTVLLTHPTYVERVLVDDHETFRKGGEEFFGGLIPNGLVVTDGEQWRRDRELLAPMFYRDRIESFGTDVARFADDAAASFTTGEPVRVDTAMRRLTLRALTKTLLDVDLTGRGEVVDRSIRALSEAFEPGTLSMLLPAWVPTPTKRRRDRAVADLHDLVDDLVAERTDPGSRDDLLSLMLTAEYEDGTTMDRATIRDQTITFLFNGHKSSSLALTYALFLLANDRERQRRLRTELDDAIGTGRPTVAAVSDVPYLDAVIDEALRLYPPSPITYRIVRSEATVDGYTLPVGSLVALPQWIVHRDERWYDDPTAFRPERWLDESDGNRPEGAFFPFGLGPRHCIGMRFARLEIRLVLAALCQRYRFEPVTKPPLDLSIKVTLQPSDGVEVVPREH